MTDKVVNNMKMFPGKWLVSGVAGFIGSNILEMLLASGQTVTGLDNFSTGYRSNLDAVRALVGEEAWSRFKLVEGDIRDREACSEACAGIRYVLHQAALGSVPRSIEEPAVSNAVNVDGFVNMLVAARDAKVKRFVYASSSAVYGDHPDLPKLEEHIGRQLSPYAATKRANELYADVFSSCYGMEIIGLRYFNIFGPRQDPAGAYAAVIPAWFAALLSGETVFINGDGETSRDFCYVENAVRANLLAAMSQHPDAIGKTYNVACGQRTTLNELYGYIRSLVAELKQEAVHAQAVFRDERAGDVRHSQADISLARNLLDYQPLVQIEDGLALAKEWYSSSPVLE